MRNTTTYNQEFATIRDVLEALDGVWDTAGKVLLARICKLGC